MQFSVRVFCNNRDGTFTNIAPQLDLTSCRSTMSGTVGDFNNDGYLDLWAGKGDPNIDRTEPSVILENDGHRFHNVTFTAGRPFTGRAMASIWPIWPAMADDISSLPAAACIPATC
jgi:FG-GAP-like repeat